MQQHYIKAMSREAGAASEPLEVLQLQPIILPSIQVTRERFSPNKERILYYLELTDNYANLKILLTICIEY